MDMSADVGPRADFSTLSKCMGANCVEALYDPKGWLQRTGRSEIAEVILTKKVEGSERELRLFRWMEEDKLPRYSLEVGPVECFDIISHIEGRIVGDSKLKPFFESALRATAGGLQLPRPRPNDSES